MYHFISKKIVSRFIAFDVIKQSDKDIYEYGFELLLATTVSILSITTISIIVHRFVMSLLFMVGFIVARLCCGGYHANHHLSCYIITIANYSFFLVATLFLQDQHIGYLLIIFTVLSSIIIFLFAPIEHKNNPLSENEKKRHKKRSRIAVSVFTMISFISIIMNIYFILSFSFITGVFSVSISVIIAKLENLVQKLHIE